MFDDNDNNLFDKNVNYEQFRLMLLYTHKHTAIYSLNKYISGKIDCG